MNYASLEACLTDLEKNGHLIRIKEEVDPYLEMAAIHLRVYEAQGPALLFERVKGCRYRAASNIFGTLERSRFIFRRNFETIQQLIKIRNNPGNALKSPLKSLQTGVSAINALPLRNPLQKPVLFSEIRISDLPQVQHWPMDGGAFVTLPQVYTENAAKPGIAASNLGMYRIQLSGNDYVQDEEIGLHYQLHRGIGVHQAIANKLGIPLKVSVFVGGPPSHTLAAVMPLPEGMSELNFAGVLGGRRFRYMYKDGYCISTDADIVITGEVMPGENKPEGPFGDHLGYYSLQHPFPLMRVHKVYARNNAIWPFTVVGRPPQEDTSFGNLIHELTGDAVQSEIPGLKELHAVDAAGVHPLLLAIGSERYTPYLELKQPAEILTIANRMLGTGQLSLAKFLFITADDSNTLHCHDIPNFFDFVLKRFKQERDLHFYTNTSIDTLDYSGVGLNKGSKVVIAVHGDVIRKLCPELPPAIQNAYCIQDAVMAMPGIACIRLKPFTTYEAATIEMDVLNSQLEPFSDVLQELPVIVVCDDPGFTAALLNNFLWVTFTRCNPSHDIYGIGSFYDHKHWGCTGPVIFDARKKPHHAPPVEKDKNVESKIDRLFSKGGSLYNVLK